MSPRIKGSLNKTSLNKIKEKKEIKKENIMKQEEKNIINKVEPVNNLSENKTSELDSLKQQLADMQRLVINLSAASSTKESVNNVADNKNYSLISPLSNKKVIISVIERQQNPTIKEGEGSTESTMITGSRRSLTCPADARTGLYKDPLTPEERKFLEHETKIDLNPLNPTSTNFYSTSTARLVFYKKNKKLSSADLILDLTQPIDYILYKIALANADKVAKTWEDRFNNPEYEYVIRDDESEVKEEIVHSEKEAIVAQYLLTNKTSHKKLFDLIRLYGVNGVDRKVKKDTPVDQLFNELWKLTKSIASIRILYNILSLTEKELEGRILLEDAITAGLIVRYGLEYKLQGGENIGYSPEEAIVFLMDAKNQPTKFKIQEGIKKFFA